MISARTEMAAPGVVRSLLVSSTDSELEKMVLERLDEFGTDESNVGNFAAPCERNAEKSLSEWAKDRGVKSNIGIADFEGYGRGGAAACDLKAGDFVLEIPSEIIISETVTLESDVVSRISVRFSPCLF
ncbi:uncharacterized protein LOC112342723 [Selaginella moellendorffii]|uniref:uncharacterized protein LOC112342723 n=1 Tax=Selaginella moellendorffii TaxID=88036 RepID=UPI000D1C464C|nr:uncharacterized protein LOC112342723 [Selaginella moellendorffii]|eukprot:XP_024520742.1 uncharacterized protein LOC112342723 [Selaginella moellendorffii]